MAKIFEFSGGSYIDKVYGSVGVPSGGGSFERTEKGLAWRGNGSDSKIAITETTYDVDGSTYSFEFWAKFNPSTLNSRVILGHDSTSYYKYIIFVYDAILGWRLIIETDTNNDVDAGRLHKEDNEYHHYIISINNSVATFYQDGISLISGETALSNNITFNLIGNTNSLYTNDGDIGRIQIYDHVLTEKERAKLLNEFNNAHPITKTIR